MVKVIRARGEVSCVFVVAFAMGAAAWACGSDADARRELAPVGAGTPDADESNAGEDPSNGMAEPQSPDSEGGLEPTLSLPPGDLGTIPPGVVPPPDEDGYELWLRYPRITDEALAAQYRAALGYAAPLGDSATLSAALEELDRGAGGLLGAPLERRAEIDADGALVLGTVESPLLAALPLAAGLAGRGAEAYVVQTAEISGRRALVVAGNSDLGVLYGTFALLSHLQRHRALEGIALESAPRIAVRMLNHWDNLDRTVERGYAGASLWEWDALPDTLSPRYRDYARANASIGINGAALTNVNANAQVLTPAYLEKVRALADVFRPYGIRVYLTARFSAPIEIGGLGTADPSSAAVQSWWSAKADEIYALIPDFGGFLVKANSEGQPGPQDYGRTHADGANALADAVAPYGGRVIWRAFVYSSAAGTDRIRQAYDEFQPLDGNFRENVVVQVKNGPLDFQPREPFSPLFGAMPATPLALELQITKEYLGQDTHLAYLGPLYEEVLDADTLSAGPGSTVARVIDGSLEGHAESVIAGVSNIGTDQNWTGSHMNQANWYVFGRMAWDPELAARDIAEEWLRRTLSNDSAFVEPALDMMMGSREAVVSYMTPLGLAHQMGTDHHYGPAPWVNDLGRPDWNPYYYHAADASGLGFDRTATGSNAVEQYFSPLREELADRATVPEDYLLFFHRVGWNDTLSSGRSVWDELVHRYSAGVDGVRAMRATWIGLRGLVDERRFAEIAGFLEIQEYEAKWWRDASLAYFGQFAAQPIPKGYEETAFPLEFYQSLNCPPDRTRPRCEAVYVSAAAGAE